MGDIKGERYSLFQIGGNKKPFPFESEAGAKGHKKGTPKELKLQRIDIYINNPKAMPKKPAINPSNINPNLKYLKWKPKEKSGIAKEAIPVIATIIIKIGLTIPALTAACPKTNAPTIPDSRSNRRRHS